MPKVPIGVVLGIVGAVLILAAAFVGWYQFSSSEGGVTATITFDPGNSEYYTCSGSPSNNSSNPSVDCAGLSASETYAGAGQNSTGTLYGAVQILCLLGFVAGLVGALLPLLMASRRPDLAARGYTLATLGFLLGILGPVIVALGQPGALSNDFSQGGHAAPSTGPWATFIGSDTVGTTTVTWGPYLGWYLALAGAVLLLVAGIFLWRSRPKPEPTVASGPDASGSGAPPVPGETYTLDRPYGDSDPSPPN